MANRTPVLFPQLAKRRNRAAIERTIAELRKVDRIADAVRRRDDRPRAAGGDPPADRQATTGGRRA
jgi:hypothetical protein